MTFFKQPQKVSRKYLRGEKTRGELFGRKMVKDVKDAKDMENVFKMSLQLTTVVLLTWFLFSFFIFFLL